DAARAAGHTVVMAGSIDAPLAQRLLAEAGLEVTEAAEDLEVLAAEQGASVVHVDDYTIGTEARDQVHAAGALLSSMEDGSFGRRPADVVVDSTIRAERSGRPEDGSGTVLQGIAYAPMRAEVCAAADGVAHVSVIAPEHSWDAVRAEAGEAVELLGPSPAFLEHASAADLVVSAAGTTAWELACIGVPSLLVAVVENQRAGYEA